MWVYLARISVSGKRGGTPSTGVSYCVDNSRTLATYLRPTVCATRLLGLPARNSMDAAGSHRGRAPWVRSSPLHAAPNSVHTLTCLPCMVVIKFTSSSLIGMSGSKDSLVVGANLHCTYYEWGTKAPTFSRCGRGHANKPLSHTVEADPPPPTVARLSAGHSAGQLAR